MSKKFNLCLQDIIDISLMLVYVFGNLPVDSTIRYLLNDKTTYKQSRTSTLTLT